MKTCEHCKADFSAKTTRVRFCSLRCSALHRHGGHKWSHVELKKMMARDGLKHPKQKSCGTIGRWTRLSAGIQRPDWKGVADYDETRWWSNHPEKYKYNAWKTSKTKKYRARIKKRDRLKRASSQHRIHLSMRLRVWKMLKVQGQDKNKGTMQYLGCTKVELQMHLQSLFKPGMAWNNYGKYWEIDHVRPCASFNFSKPEDVIACFHYTNLQPLTIRENRSKHSRYGGKTHWHRRLGQDNF